MAYADDVIIMGRRWQDVKEVLTSLVEQTNKKELEVNKKKLCSITKALQWKWICKTRYMWFFNSERLYISWYNTNR